MVKEKVPLVSPMYSKNDGYGGCAVFDLNDNGEPEMVGFRPAGNKILVEVGGNLTDPNKGESFHDCDTPDECLAYLWAYCICEHPTHAWFNDPNSGLISNLKFTQDRWDKLPREIKKHARRIAFEDNQCCQKDGIRPRKPWIDGGI